MLNTPELGRRLVTAPKQSNLGALEPATGTVPSSRSLEAALDLHIYGRQAAFVICSRENLGAAKVCHFDD